MAASFVPLIARKTAGSGTASEGGAQAGPPTPAFAPLRVHNPGSCNSVPGSTQREPVVTLQKVDDQVTGIRIECGCGQVIELACTY